MNDYNQTPAGILVPRQNLVIGGEYHGQIIRDGKIIDDWTDHNLVVNEGLDALLNIMFFAQTQITAWYLGLFEGNYTPVATVTAATITAAATETTAYVSTTRPVYTAVASSGQSETNAAARASFVFNATKTIYGAFMVSNATKSSTAGKLFSAAQFAASKSVVSGDELLLTYTFNASSI